MGGDNHGIDGLVWSGRVTTTASDLDLDVGRRGEERAGSNVDCTDGNIGTDVEAEHAIDVGGFENPIGDAGLRATNSLLGGLENEADRSAEGPRAGGEEFCDTERDGGMCVMAAGVHDAFAFRSIRKAGLFRDGQCIDVGAPEDGGAGPIARDERRRAGLGDGTDIIELEFAEAIKNDALGAGFVPGELGVLVQIAAGGNKA